MGEYQNTVTKILFTLDMGLESIYVYKQWRIFNNFLGEGRVWNILKTNQLYNLYIFFIQSLGAKSLS